MQKIADGKRSANSELAATRVHITSNMKYSGVRFSLPTIVSSSFGSGAVADRTVSTSSCQSDCLLNPHRRIVAAEKMSNASSKQAVFNGAIFTATIDCVETCQRNLNCRLEPDNIAGLSR